jgi:site-specific recombinase XerD
MEDPSRACVAGPLEPYAEGFAAELARLGYASGSAYGQMLLMAHVSRWLFGEGLDAGGLTPEAAERFLADRRAVGYVLYRSPKALVPLLGFLRRVGAAPEAPPPAPAGPADVLLDRYRRYLVAERGLAAETAADYAAKVRAFASGRVDCGLAGLTAAEVTAFVVQTCPSMRKGTAKLTVTALRSLLGWLHLAGEIPGPLAWAVPAVASRRLAALPAPLNPAQVQAMLDGCDTGTAVGRRDLAMLTVLARLGLRAGEVAALSLDDIDWRAGDITVTGKGRRSERLPLPADVGEVIASYLRDGRPSPFEGARNVFLRSRAPHRRLTSTGVSQAVLGAGQRAGIEGVFAHRLRHSAATGMLRAGASLPEVGQVLRHRRLLSTAIYAKTDVPSLRALARPWPSGGAA